MNRARKAAEDRGVSMRPVPDVMALLTARLPAPQAVACFKALRKHAEAMRAKGDPRTVQALMADELCARVTGRQVVDGIDIEVGLVITDDALFAGDCTAADLEDYGPIPAEVARDLLRPRADDVEDQDDTPDQPADADTPQDQADADGAPNNQAAAAQPDHQSETDTPHIPAPERTASAAPSPELCPDGPRCARWYCALRHEILDPVRMPTPDGGSSTTPGPGCGPPPTARPSSTPAIHDDSRPPKSVVKAATVWLRRLYTDPVSGVLTERDLRRRLFTGSLRATLIARGRYCANAWCGAPIRHIDHVERFSDGGPTNEANGRGLCARCNLARERERCRSPEPQDYRPPPPLLDGFHRAAPARAAPQPRAG